MLKLFLKITFLFIIVSSIITGIMFLPGDKTGYIFSDIEKLQRLEKCHSPKIILVGGSNVAMGFDSELLEKEMKMPVVNMGLHAGLGLRFLFERARNHIHKGDMVIVSPEYENYFDDFYNGVGLIIGATIAALPKHVQFISNHQQVRLTILNMSNIINDRIFYYFRLYLTTKYDLDINKPTIDELYNRKGFNQRGDMISHLKLKSPGMDMKNIPDFSTGLFNKEIYQFLKELNDYIANRGGALYYSFPFFAEGAYMKNKIRIESIYKKLKCISDITPIDSPSDGSYPDSFFFDNFYHLNAEGCMLRKKMLIHNLQKLEK